ncbi:diaminopimelate epimerase [archaeon CG10_big_fil_rev_8_21_14_0_10_43_11]|nr:MAG: diaminopimelate epimerase [archaeon CG10_big_fil_rev_8_21_14_0_10_43_11]
MNATVSAEDEPPDIPFTKMQGCGNDFIILELNTDHYANLHKLCDRHFGIGADQVLLIQPSDVADAKMVVLERDGSQSDMCGNGIRCVARYLIERKGFGPNVRIETRAGIKEVLRVEDLFQVDMGAPRNVFSFTFHFEGHEYDCVFVNSGEPHVVMFVPDVDQFNLHACAAHIRTLQNLPETRVNVNLVHVVNETMIRIRTFERGVEAETLSCGTGATACTIAAVIARNMQNTLTVITRGGPLVVDCTQNPILLGPADIVFDGVIKKDRSACNVPLIVFE